MLYSINAYAPNNMRQRLRTARRFRWMKWADPAGRK